MLKPMFGLALGLALLAVPLFAPRAEACGGFFSRAVEGVRRPSLAYEQALIVFDATKRREHFVREVVFRAAQEPFGFVVPTPTRPEVAAVKKSPFTALRTQFPFEERTKGLRLGGMGGGMPAGAVGVQVRREAPFDRVVRVHRRCLPQASGARGDLLDLRAAGGRNRYATNTGGVGGGAHAEPRVGTRAA